MIDPREDRLPDGCDWRRRRARDSRTIFRGILLLALAAASLAGCKRSEQDAPVPAPPIPSRAPPSVPVPGEPAPSVDPQAAAACRQGFNEARIKLEQIHPMRRLVPALRAVGAHCQGAVGTLALAAREAGEVGMPRRAVLLAAAATQYLPPTCATPDPAGPALEVSHACPPPDAFSLAEPLLMDLDAGTYLYALALREQLGRAGALDDAVDRVLATLVLAGALEGEQRRQVQKGP
jgi:hypothetical protein